MMKRISDFGDKNGIDALRFEKEQTKSLCMAAISQDSSAIRHVRDQTKDLCIFAIRCHEMEIMRAKTLEDEIRERVYGSPLQFMRNQDPDVCMEAVKATGFAIRFAWDQTPDLCLAAVQEDGRALIFVRNQTERICLAAVSQNGDALAHAKIRTEAVQMAAVKNRPQAIRFIADPSLSVSMEAVRRDGRVLDYIENPDPSVIEEAIAQNPRVAGIRDIAPARVQFPDGTVREWDENGIPEAERVAAVSQEPSLLRKIFRRPTKAMLFAAVASSPEAVKWAPKPMQSEDLCAFACSLSCQALFLLPLEKQTPTVCEAAFKNFAETHDGFEAFDSPLEEALRGRRDPGEKYEICLAAVKSAGILLKDVPEPFRTEEICMAAAGSDDWGIQLVHDDELTENICLAAARHNGMALEHIPGEFQTERVVRAALDQNPEAAKFLKAETGASLGM